MSASRPAAALGTFALGFVAGVAATLLLAYLLYDERAWADAEEARRRKGR